MIYLNKGDKMFIQLSEETIINTDHLICVNRFINSNAEPMDEGTIEFAMVGNNVFTYNIRNEKAINTMLSIAKDNCDKAKSAYFEFIDSLESPYEKAWEKYKKEVEYFEDLLKGARMSSKQALKIINSLEGER